VFGGVPKLAIEKAVREAQIFVSPVLLKEYRQIPFELELDGKINREQLKILIAGIATFVSKAIIINPITKLQICRDPEDNMLLECCLTAKADFLITGDKDLLVLKKLPFNLNIIPPREYVGMRT
ncbi:MAG: putative toxin-antitoxin system toxin component, PIN family, partial [bacterium]